MAIRMSKPWPSTFQCDKATVWRACHRYQTEASSAYSPTAGRNTRGDTPRFRPLQRAQIVDTGRLGALGQEGCTSPSGPVNTCQRPPAGDVGARKLHAARLPTGRDGGRFQTCFSEASTHQTVNRERREETCPSRVVAGEFAERDETCWQTLEVPESRRRGRILGLHTNEEVTRQSQGLCESGIVTASSRLQTSRLRRARFKSTELSDAERNHS